jgi:RNA polymerase sigma-54 factor
MIYAKTSAAIAAELEAEALINPHLSLSPPPGTVIRPVRVGPLDPRAGAFPEQPAPDLSLWERLVAQAGAEFRGRDHELALRVLGCMTETGLLDREDYEKLRDEIGVEALRMVRVLAAMRRFEPVGVLARSISERIRTQLRRSGDLTEDVCRVLASLELAAEGGWEAVQRACALCDERFHDAVARIQSAPRDFSSAVAAPPHVIPDLIVVTRRGELIAIRHPRALPQAHQRNYGAISGPLARSALVAGKRLGELENYLSRLESVGTQLVRQQEAYLSKRATHPRPFSQKQLAELTSLSKSDISRAVRGRTIETPRGVIYMQELFPKDEGILVAIRNIFETDPTITDAAMHGRLRAAGIPVSRRTVSDVRTKHRLRVNRRTILSAD